MSDDQMPMVFSDGEIYDAARMLADGLQDGAAQEAGSDAVACYLRGDVDGQKTWTRILRAVLELQRAEPAEGEVTH